MTYDPTATKKARRAAIVDAIDRSDVFVERAILAIYERQTADEKVVGITTDDNGVGFSGCHSEIGSSFAEQILANKYGNDDGRRLSPKQMAVARKIARRYSRQLIEIADERSAPKPIEATVETTAVSCSICDDTISEADYRSRPVADRKIYKLGELDSIELAHVECVRVGDGFEYGPEVERSGGVVLTVQPEGNVDPAVRDAAIESDRFAAWCL